MELPVLNFPSYDFRLREEGGRAEIFDEWRKIWVRLTPEEWVRQHAARWLKEEKKYPAGLTSLERTIRVNGMTKRCDVVAFGKSGEPVLIVECKAPDVRITQDVFDQAARYNLSLGADLFFLTNGLNHYCCRADHEGKKYHFLKELPPYQY
ncbi:MAG TPA: type I restriction enzyme HsdR N-terminal domain-containing protein [Bacteroidia bacterium]|nr:type I restriction enzyme HsdR N-terminal domain-containing protein [Bacteroidia bacterium]